MNGEIIDTLSLWSLPIYNNKEDNENMNQDSICCAKLIVEKNRQILKHGFTTLLITRDYKNEYTSLFMEPSEDSLNMGNILIPRRYMKNIRFNSEDLSISFPFKARIYVYNVIHVHYVAYETIVRFTCEVPEYIFVNTVNYDFAYVPSYTFQNTIDALLNNSEMDIQTPMNDVDMYFKIRESFHPVYSIK